MLFPMKPIDPKPFNSEQSDLLRRTITAHLSDDEHALFVEACERSGLDPFARHIYPAKRREINSQTGRYEDKFSAEATIDGLRLTAERTGKYAGQLGPEWCGSDGAWKDIWTASEPPAGARVGILRSDFKEPVWGKALYSEFVQTGQNGEPTPFWFKMPANQLAKVAEALGFRKCFPREFAGIYTRDEMAQADNVIAIKKPEERVTVELEERSIPVPLRQFVNRGTGDRKNVTAAFKFLEDELIQAAGLNGAETFKQITIRLPRTFKTKQECAAATVGCWLELYGEVERALKTRSAA